MCLTNHATGTSLQWLSKINKMAPVSHSIARAVLPVHQDHVVFMFLFWIHLLRCVQVFAPATCLYWTLVYLNISALMFSILLLFLFPVHTHTHINKYQLLIKYTVQ